MTRMEVRKRTVLWVNGNCHQLEIMTMCAEHVEETVDVQLVMELVSLEQNKFWNTTNIVKQIILFIKIK